jgi:hypothetical protein
MGEHCRVERLSIPIVVPAHAKVRLVWAVVCNVTGGRVTARRTKAEAELTARITGEEGCWCCAEAQKETYIRQLETVTP